MARTIRRPGVKEVFAKIKEDGHHIFLWSGGRNPWTAVQDFSLWEMVSDCYLKPTADHDNHMSFMQIPIPDFTVDDNREIIDVFGGYWLPPYTHPELPDDHIYRAYEAFKKTEEGKSDKKIDDFTPDQRFFLSWAQVWRSNILPEYAAQLIVVDPHSPGMYRCNGPLTNIDAWYKAFNVQPGNKMYKPENERIKMY